MPLTPLVVLPDEKAVGIPEQILEKARENVEKDHLRIYLCKKYNMPQTDPRLLAYTPEMALIEYVEDAIIEERLPIGMDGKPIRKIRHKGVEIYQTGDPMFDAFEREWAEQDISHLEKEGERIRRESMSYDGDADVEDLLAKMSKR